MIYLDNAATTKTHEDVVKEMLPYFTENYGNASSVYDLGSKANLPYKVQRDDRSSIKCKAGGNLFYSRWF